MQNADCYVNDIDGKSRDIYTYIIYQTDYTYKNAYKVKNMSKDSTDLFISYTIYPWQVDSKYYLQRPTQDTKAVSKIWISWGWWCKKSSFFIVWWIISRAKSRLIIQFCVWCRTGRRSSCRPWSLTQFTTKRQENERISTTV